jgi:SNF2 family DNA or RNA helicase
VSCPTLPTLASLSLYSSAVEGATFLRLTGGSPAGGDDVHRLVSAWHGWRRFPLIGDHKGARASVYQARAWASCALPILRGAAQGKLDLDYTPEARAWLQRAAAALHEREAMLKAKPAPDAAARWKAHHAGREPMPHQVQALAALQTMAFDGVLLDDDMGLGKTTTATLAWAQSPHKRLLVVCPKSVKLNWLEEIQVVFGGIEGTQVAGRTTPLLYVIDGSAKQKQATIGYMKEVLGEKGTLAAAIINYDLLWKLVEDQWTTLERWCYGQAVVFDEFHYCKGDSKRSKSCEALARFATFRMGLTGTPVQNTVEDLFQQIEILRPGTWVNYHDFKNRYLVTSVIQPNKASKKKLTIVREGKNLPELKAILNTMRVGRRKEDVLTLPPKIVTKPKLELADEHYDIYKTLKEFARIELEKLVKDNNEEMTIFHPLARSGMEMMMRLEMIAQGFISGLPEEYAEKIGPIIKDKAEKIESFRGAFSFPGSVKLEWVTEQIETNLANKPVAVVSRFNAPLYWMKERYKDKASLLVGELDTYQRHDAIKDFKEGKRRIILIQVKMAEGFNLQTALDAIFHGRDWAPAKNAQAEGRFHRLGTAGTVNIQIPIVANTIERFIDKKLVAKEADANQALANCTIRELLEEL